MNTTNTHTISEADIINIISVSIISAFQMILAIIVLFVKKHLKNDIKDVKLDLEEIKTNTSSAPLTFQDRAVHEPFDRLHDDNNIIYLDEIVKNGNTKLMFNGIEYEISTTQTPR